MQEKKSLSSNPALLAGLTFILLFGEVKAQLDFLTCSDSTFCIPSVSGLPRSKGFELKRESFAPHSIETEDMRFDALATSTADLKQNERWSFKLRAPFLMKDHLSLALGLRYSIEEFNFKSPNELDDEFLRQLEDKPLRSAGLNLYLAKPFKGNRFLISRVQADVNGDFALGGPDLSDYFKLSGAALYVYKVDSDKTMAVGLSYSYVFGRASIIPIVAFYRTSFDERWGIELVLPASARIRLMPNPKNVFYLGVDLNGAGYLIHLDDSDNPLFLETSELRLELRYEREIHDWLWIGASLGYRQNLNFNVSNVDALQRRPSDIVLESEVNGALLYSMGIFIVPPRKFLN